MALVIEAVSLDEAESRFREASSDVSANREDDLATLTLQRFDRTPRSRQVMLARQSRFFWTKAHRVLQSIDGTGRFAVRAGSA